MSDEVFKEMLERHGAVSVDTMEEPKTLEHHGVKGQKWGVRRATSQAARLNRQKVQLDKAAGGASPANKARYEKSSREKELQINRLNAKLSKKGAPAVRVKGTPRTGAKADTKFTRPQPVSSGSSKSGAKKGKHLTDEELQTRIKRMELEKKYKDLNNSDVSAGKKFTNDVLNTSGKKVATTVLTGAALLVVGAAISKKFGPGVGKALSGVDLGQVKTAAGTAKTAVGTAGTAAKAAGAAKDVVGYL